MEILYEDNHLIAVNKPFGMLSQGDATGDKTVIDWVMEYIRVTYNKPGNVYVGLLHRLDRPTGGVILLAKTSKAASRMSVQFQERKPRKIYYAITERAPSRKEGDLKHYLKQLDRKNIIKAHDREVKGSKASTLSYRVLQVKGKKALLEVELKTGRKHQIRVQLASIGCTIVGDMKYGQTQFLPDKSIGLIAKELSFVHPTTKELIKIEAPLPKNGIWADFR